MAPLDVVVDLKSLRRGTKRSRLFRLLERSQLPFAAARALTVTGKWARSAVEKDLSNHFEIRNTRVRRGIRSTFADKRDWPDIQTAVGSIDSFMAPHATGGTKRARGGGRILIPMRPIRRTATGRIRKSQRPSELRSKSKTYVEGNILTLRASTGRRKPPKLRKLYLMRDKAKIEKSWPLQKVVARAVRKHYPREFKRSMSQAIRSAR